MFIEAGKPEFNRRMFPSPLGEMGLSIGYSHRHWNKLSCVSVPSRGNGVIDYTVEEINALDLETSFRPLSGKWGYRSVNTSVESTMTSPVSVPSRGNGVIDRARAVSVPSRGNGVIDSIDNAIST